MQILRSKWVGLLALSVAIIGLSGWLLRNHIDAQATPSNEYNGKDLDFWRERLANADATGRFEAATALGTFGPKASKAVPLLAKMLLEEEQPELRNQAAFALSRISPECESAIPALAHALQHDRSAMIRMNAAMALFRLREQAQPAIPALIVAVQEPKNRNTSTIFPLTVQEMAALALARASVNTGEGIPVLITLLQESKSDQLTLTLVRSLGEAGPVAKSASEHLRPLLQHPIPEIQQEAAKSLELIARPE
jgi:HEAT repeat protein